jgi:hypothetical protein
MRNPVDLALLFVDIKNSRSAEFVSEDDLNFNPAVAPGRAGIATPMQQGAAR